jgi:hypothetical protein
MEPLFYQQILEKNGKKKRELIKKMPQIQKLKNLIRELVASI